MTWNVARRIKKLKDQVALILDKNPDVLALQEITASTLPLFRDQLEKSYAHIASSFDLTDDKASLKGKRAFGQLIASNYKMKHQDPKRFNVPWQERVLSCQLTMGGKSVYVHTTHIPPGSSNGWIKIEMLEGIYEYLKENKDDLNILCGDFNTPKEELPQGVVTFGQYRSAQDLIKTRKAIRGREGQRWDAGERNIVASLDAVGMRDSYRKKYPEAKAHSWALKRKGKCFKRRFDHCFLPEQFEVKDVEYVKHSHALSDHRPMAVDFTLQRRCY